MGYKLFFLNIVLIDKKTKAKLGNSNGHYHFCLRKVKIYSMLIIIIFFCLLLLFSRQYFLRQSKNSFLHYIIILDTGRSPPECLTEQLTANNSSWYSGSDYSTPIAL